MTPRVLVLSDLWVPFPGGAERLIFNVARHLHRAGQLVTVRTGYHPALTLDGPPVVVRSLGVRDDHEAGARSLASILSTVRPQVILTHHFWAFEFEAELVASGIPLVQVVLNQRRIPEAALAIYISRFVRAQMVDRAGDLLLTPPAYAEDVVADRHGDAIGFVKPIFHKGVDLVYAVAERMPERRFVVLRGEWQNIEVIRHDLPNVEYVEPVEDMRDFYARCRLALVPSLSEDAGTVAQEAALNGLPALVSDVGGLSETAAGAVLLRPLDVDGWVATIEAMDDPEAYERVVERQHAHQARAAAENLAALDCLVERVRELAR